MIPGWYHRMNKRERILAAFAHDGGENALAPFIR